MSNYTNSKISSILKILITVTMLIGIVGPITGVFAQVSLISPSNKAPIYKFGMEKETVFRPIYLNKKGPKYYSMARQKIGRGNFGKKSEGKDFTKKRKNKKSIFKPTYLNRQEQKHEELIRYRIGIEDILKGLSARASR